MKRFRFELILALVLGVLTTLYWHSQEPGDPLTKAESDRYIAVIDAKFPFPTAELKTAALIRMRGFAERDDGRDVYMLNLLRFHPQMASGPAPAAQFKGTPAQANVDYEDNAVPIALKSGSFPIFTGYVSEPNALGGENAAEDNWSRIIVMHYPSRRHFFELLTDPVYLAKADYKSYAMHMALVPVKRDMVIPDFRHLALFGAILLFLLIALVRALRREAK